MFSMPEKLSPNPLLPPFDDRHTKSGAGVLREDGKSLHIEHIVAFVEYGRHKIVCYSARKGDTLENLDMCSEEKAQAVIYGMERGTKFEHRWFHIHPPGRGAGDS
jgi:hypothetical protein